MAFLIPSIQLFFGLPRALFCFGVHFSAILGKNKNTGEKNPLLVSFSPQQIPHKLAGK
jgi:hypothetical protein